MLVRSSDRSAAAREALLQAAEVIWAVIDDYSEALSDAFRDAIADQTRRDTQVRTAVLGSVLDGSLGDGPALWEAATMLGLPHQGTFVVVAAETTQTTDEPLPRVEQALRGRDVASVWRLDAICRSASSPCSGRPPSRRSAPNLPGSLRPELV